VKSNPKKLALNRETVRALQDSELSRVAGGVTTAHMQRFPSEPEIWTLGCGPTMSCPGQIEVAMAPAQGYGWVTTG
jgi:hypothetical protein